MDHDKAKYRVLDEERWFPHHRDPETGKIIVIRGVPQSDGFDPSAEFLGTGPSVVLGGATIKAQPPNDPVIWEFLPTETDGLRLSSDGELALLGSVNESNSTTINDDAQHRLELYDELATPLLDVVAPVYPDELPEEPANGSFVEGATRQVLVNQYERDSRARSECIRHWGTACYVCGFDFYKTYGDIGRGFIHVHHLTDIASIGVEYEVDPRAHLRPVCPNCHAMLHTRRPAMDIDELKSMLA
ncbi:hypothetical protein GWC77_27575 [Paraburkholderia sp. NMBU_R16]|uniref:HNH endonuclease n=1 Tax=Paraburkholderia sp. NMBU_R16 TaxID=2698676 RepID=UPI001566DEC5|nr:HNH endonuclease [Paraburkholderia sp. NMBU_R16]NRO99617.1 hypothetical protein [Paraburkholderia sp. NMBU_R16]